MDQGVNGTRVPFDMRLPVPHMAQTSYTADPYHAMKRLADEGYITIKPNAKLRMVSQGVWKADGQPLLAETTSREGHLVQPCVSADDITPPELHVSHYSHDDQGPYLMRLGPETQVLRQIAEAKKVLMTKHDNAHPTWTILEEALKKSSPLSWTEHTLEDAITGSYNEEKKDWYAFIMSHTNHRGSHLSARHVGEVNDLMRALYHFCGCPKDKTFFPDDISAEDERNEKVVTEKLNALKLGARIKDRPNAIIITLYVESVRSARGVGCDCQHKLVSTEEFYDHLTAMIEERLLGERMLQVLDI